MVFKQNFEGKINHLYVILSVSIQAMIMHSIFELNCKLQEIEEEIWNNCVRNYFNPQILKSIKKELPLSYARSFVRQELPYSQIQINSDSRIVNKLENVLWKCRVRVHCSSPSKYYIIIKCTSSGINIIREWIEDEGGSHFGLFLSDRRGKRVSTQRLNPYSRIEKTIVYRNEITDAFLSQTYEILQQSF